MIRACIAAAAMGSILWATAADAQVPLTMNFDEVLVTPIQPQGSGLDDEAARLDEMLRIAVATTNVTIPFEEVKPFDEFVNATNYLMDCPHDQYSGCQLVLAQRGEADWAIGGTLVSVSDALGGGALELKIKVVDVQGSREVMAFGVVVGGGTDDHRVIRGVAGVFEQVLKGMADEVDVRGDLSDPAAERDFEKRRQALIASSLARMETDLGVVVREESVREIEPVRTKNKDFDEFSQREDVAPWERLRMSRFQYVHFENAEISVQDYRMRMRGRMGQILLRLNFGGGPGPWGLHHEGRWIVGPDEASGGFTNVEVRQYQEVRQTSSTAVQFEVGFGLLPFLEASFVYGLRNAPFTFRFDQDVEDEPTLVPGVSTTTGRTTRIGGRMLFAPLPTYPVRPTVHVGYFTWNGSAIVPAQEPLVPLEGPYQTLFEVGPGVEVSAGRNLNLFLRVPIEIPLSGFYYDDFHSGIDGSLKEFEGPLGDYGGGYTVLVGMQARINLLKPPPDGNRPGALLDDEMEEPDL